MKNTTKPIGIFAMPDPKINPMEFLQVACGNALMGNPAQLCVFIVGKGCNGKTTFIQSLIDGLGKGFFHFAEDELYVGVSKFKRRKDSFAGMDEAKFSIQTDPEPNAKLRGDVIKQVCSHDEVFVNKNSKNVRTIRPTAMPIIVSNVLPDMENESEGVKIRIHVVEFTQDYFDAKPLTEADKKKMANDRLEWVLRGKQKFIELNPLLQTPTDFNIHEVPPSWAHLGDRDGIPSPLEFKNVAWMRRGSSYGGKHTVWICLIGGEPIELKGFSDADAWRLIDSWQDYRVGLPILATKGNVNDRQPS